MSDLDFYRTRAGRTYYEQTLPALVTAIQRLAAALERVADDEPDPETPDPEDNDRD